jgi:hypothetical protein
VAYVKVQVGKAALQVHCLLPLKLAVVVLLLLLLEALPAADSSVWVLLPLWVQLRCASPVYIHLLSFWKPTAVTLPWCPS